MDYEVISYQLHQFFFGWFSSLPTFLIIVFGSVMVFAAALRKWRVANVILWPGALAVILPQAIPFLAYLSSPYARQHGATIYSNLPLIVRLLLASEFLWWPAALIAFWLGWTLNKRKLVANRQVSMFE